MKETKYEVLYTAVFKRDYRRAMRRGLRIQLLQDVIAALAMGKPLEQRHHDHELQGD